MIADPLVPADVMAATAAAVAAVPPPTPSPTALKVSACSLSQRPVLHHLATCSQFPSMTW